VNAGGDCWVHGSGLAVPRLKCLTLLTSDWVAEDGVLLLPESGSESTQQFHTSPLRADFSMHHLKGAPMSKSAASSGEQHVLVAILYSIDILSPDFRRLQTHTLVREGVVHPSVIYYKLLSYVTNGGELTQLTPTLPTNQYSQTRSRCRGWCPNGVLLLPESGSESTQQHALRSRALRELGRAGCHYRHWRNTSCLV
jgi:hypothetical protein